MGSGGRQDTCNFHPRRWKGTLKSIAQDRQGHAETKDENKHDGCTVEVSFVPNAWKGCMCCGSQREQQFRERRQQFLEEDCRHMRFAMSTVIVFLPEVQKGCERGCELGCKWL